MLSILLGSAGRVAETDGEAAPGGRRDGLRRRLVQWVFLYGNRRQLALVLSVVILLSLLAVGSTWEFEMERLVTETRAVQTLFNTLLGGVILFVSVVLSINTAALAQEFAPLQTKLAQIEDSIELQVELEAFVDDGVSPAGLGPFLEFVIRVVRSETSVLRESADDAGEEALREDLLALADDIEADLSQIEYRLRGENPRLALVLLGGLDFPYAHHINAARHVRAAHRTALTESDRETIDSLLRSLTVFASGREYFTTLYFKRELRNLSSNLLVLSLPVIVFTAYVLLAIDANLFPETSLPWIEPRLLYVNVAFVVALSPYVLLSSYMLRIVTVSKHSLESTVFSLDDDR